MAAKYPEIFFQAPAMQAMVLAALPLFIVKLEQVVLLLRMDRPREARVSNFFNSANRYNADAARRMLGAGFMLMTYNSDVWRDSAPENTPAIASRSRETLA
ncbi:MAG: hypothetical protein NXI24_02720 [bacterium]|nr:hypothetical protein [bacterium]